MPFCLLDEVEKAHPDVFNVLLQVLDDGRLTDSQGRTVDFRHTVVVMTSNLASRAILESARQGQESDSQHDSSSLDAAVDEALGRHFRPEFLNRIDEVIRFRPLDQQDLSRIVRLQLADLATLLREQGLTLQVDDAVIEALVSLGYEPEYGARPLRRVLRRRLENPLATELLEERFNGAQAVQVLAGSSPLLLTPSVSSRDDLQRRPVGSLFAVTCHLSLRQHRPMTPCPAIRDNANLRGHRSSQIADVSRP